MLCIVFLHNLFNMFLFKIAIFLTIFLALYYDADLQIEAYHLYGIVQKFPNHFHDSYVIGFIEGGKRHLWC